MDAGLKNLVYGMKILSGILQLSGLFIVSRIDLKSNAVDTAFENIPGNPFLDAYESAKGDGIRKLSKEELHYNELSSRDNPARNVTLIKWSIGMVGLGMALQLTADIIEPS
ncbi:hypothetical protein [Pseudomonas mandelii]